MIMVGMTTQRKEPAAGLFSLEDVSYVNSNITYLSVCHGGRTADAMGWQREEEARGHWWAPEAGLA